MISVDSITIKEFRGIRNLTLQLSGKTFAVCGRNGTGKSGVVDALEFVLTGNVSRLTGEGRKEVSVEEHGPHVNSRNNPDKARVSAQIKLPSGAAVTIERSAKSPRVVSIVPVSPEAESILQQLAEHPEIVLSRRELIRYVLATPGKRSEEVQALLHLDQVDQVRGGLQKLANAAEKALKLNQAETKRTQASLIEALELSTLTKKDILDVVNERRKVIGLPALTELSAKTNLKDGLATAAGKASKVSKVQATLDVKSANESLDEMRSEKTARKIETISAELLELSSNPSARTGVTSENFYKLGLELIDDVACPFCDDPWDLEKLKAHVQQKLSSLKVAAQKRAAVQKKITELTEPLDTFARQLDTLARHASVAEPAQKMPALRAFRQKLAERIQTLERLMPFNEARDALATLTDIPKSALEEMDAFAAYVGAMPNVSKEQNARDWLVVSQERFENWNAARKREKDQDEAAKRARKVSDTYAEVSDKVLTDIYTEVQSDFASLYREMHNTDEGNFEARLEPSLGKLGFNVDFYGKGFFPPGAYHSEGHQDSMGLCLYLALMKRLHGANFRFAVLDDVLMSVDSGHRREVCALLKKHFPSTQFVLTTHDPIWLRHMRVEGLVTSASSVTFKSWDVEHGPTRFAEGDVWQEIETNLKGGDVRTAAGTLRHYLEFVSAELCHNLRAPVEFRGDARYQLGELLPAAIGQLKALYRKGKNAAQTWGRTDAEKAITERETAFCAAVATANVEQWQTNYAIHFNAWENLSPEEFAKVVDAFKVLLEAFSCPKCSTPFVVSPDRETAEIISCSCGEVAVKLLAKKKT